MAAASALFQSAAGSAGAVAAPAPAAPALGSSGVLPSAPPVPPLAGPRAALEAVRSLAASDPELVSLVVAKGPAAAAR